MEEARNKKCGKCKSYRYPCDFLKEGRELKTCIKCRELARQSRIKNRCPHGKRKCRCLDCGGGSLCQHGKIKYNCKDCGGSGYCKHSKLKTSCLDCGGSSLCEHDKQKAYCKECGGSQICEHNIQKNYCKVCYNPIKIVVRNWLSHCRYEDRKYNRYEPDRFIDKCFLQGLIEDYHSCYYEDCKVELQYVVNQDNLATIERLDNSIGHIKSNCVLCCYKCNRLKKSNHLSTKFGGSSVSSGTT